LAATLSFFAVPIRLRLLKNHAFYYWQFIVSRYNRNSAEISFSMSGKTWVALKALCESDYQRVVD
jgi:hypothetical protein